MNKLVFTFVFGTVLGAGGAFALAPQAQVAADGSADSPWTELHAAIPAQPDDESAPTF